MIYYYTYKIICLKGSFKDHYYLGQKKSRKFPDNYTGSGRLIRDYFKKYGKIEGVTYIKEVLNFYNNPDELNEAEFELIGDKYETDELCLNLRAGGGHCGCSEETLSKFRNWKRTDKVKNKISEGRKGISAWNKGLHYECNVKCSDDRKLKISKANKGKTRTTEQREYISQKTKEAIKDAPKSRFQIWKGKHFSEEHRKHLSESTKGKSKSFKGKTWVIDEETHKRKWI